jgi:hypothetical protein
MSEPGVWRVISYDRPRTGRQVANQRFNGLPSATGDGTGSRRSSAADIKRVKREISRIEREPLLSDVLRPCVDVVRQAVEETNTTCHIVMEALGVGSIDTEDSAVQLAVFVALRNALVASESWTADQQVPTVKAFFFDPLASTDDTAVVEHFGVTVDNVNRFGAARATQGNENNTSEGDGTTLWIGFMPRCPRELYHNALVSVVANALPFVIIGNDLLSYMDTSVYGSTTDKRPLAFNAIDVVAPFLQRSGISASPKTRLPGGLVGLCAHRVPSCAQPSLEAEWSSLVATKGAPRVARGGLELV